MGVDTTQPIRMKHTREELRQWQALPLSIKVRMTEQRVRDWCREYGERNVHVSFSGGKDSTVLLDIVRNRMGYNVPAVFVDVPTQYPELRDFVKTFDDVTIIRPKISFMQVCEKYGFPLISKEVSECVYGARRYLKQVREQMLETIDRQTDRQTDRQITFTTNTSMISCADLASTLNPTPGGGRQQVS